MVNTSLKQSYNNIHKNNKKIILNNNFSKNSSYSFSQNFQNIKQNLLIKPTQIKKQKKIKISNDPNLERQFNKKELISKNKKIKNYNINDKLNLAEACIKNLNNLS